MNHSGYAVKHENFCIDLSLRLEKYSQNKKASHLANVREVWAKWHQKSQKSLHKMVNECMMAQKYETLKAIFEAVEALNQMKFYICASLMV